MDIKPFIDKFDVIADEPRELQFDLLTRAVEHTHKRFGVPILELAPQIIRLFFILVFAALSYEFFDTQMWAFITGIILALICSRVCISEFTDRMMLKSLKVVYPKNKDM